MIVYGDHSRRCVLGAVLAARAEAVVPGSGIEAHGRLVEALIAAGQVAQALADEDFRDAGRDREWPAASRAMRVAVAVARLVDQSWAGGFATVPAPDPRLFADLLSAVGPDRVLDVRQPEGFAHYAVYPEGYARAARTWVQGRGARVIGIRSIGTTLAATVAAVTGDPEPLTVRPVGPPFARELSLDPALAARLADPSTTAFAIVDEGPGLSGSSFGAVADALERSGVSPSCTAFFPSHSNGPGTRASPRHRERWNASRRFVQTFDDLVLAADRIEHRLEAWVEDLTGRAAAALQDVAGGRWRAVDGAERSDAPLADASGERRKFLLRGERGTFLLRFAGLGWDAAERIRLRGTLATAGFAAPLSGARHGFTVEPWQSDLRPLATAGVPRARIVDHLGRYLGLRARLPADGRSGASIEALVDMLAVNAGQALGEAAGRDAAARWRPRIPGLAAGVRLVVTDSRLQLWEWLVAPDGQILKTDAVDHYASHDLIGCQDIAWDLAGAAIEFDLDLDERARLGRAVAESGGHRPHPDLLRFYADAYAAFQVGLCDLAAARADSDDDRGRWRTRGLRLRERLRAALSTS